MENQKPDIASQLRVSEYEVLDGLISLEGEVVIKKSSHDVSDNGAAPEFVKAAITLTSIKAMYHLGAWVHIAMDKEWFLDLLFEDVDEAGDFYREFFAGLLEFYAAGDDMGDEDFPGGSASGSSMGNN